MAYYSIFNHAVDLDAVAVVSENLIKEFSFEKDRYFVYFYIYIRPVIGHCSVLNLKDEDAYRIKLSRDVHVDKYDVPVDQKELEEIQNLKREIESISNEQVKKIFQYEKDIESKRLKIIQENVDAAQEALNAFVITWKNKERIKKYEI